MLTVSKLAEATGVSPDTIRYYDRGATPCSAPDRERLQDVRRGGDQGGSVHSELAAVWSPPEGDQGLLEVMDRGLCPCGHASDLVTARIAELDQQVAELRGLRGDLARLSEEVDPDGCTPGVWPCEQEFVLAGGGGGDGP